MLLHQATQSLPTSVPASPSCPAHSVVATAGVLPWQQHHRSVAQQLCDCAFVSLVPPYMSPNSPERQPAEPARLPLRCTRAHSLGGCPSLITVHVVFNTVCKTLHKSTWVHQEVLPTVSGPLAGRQQNLPHHPFPLCAAHVHNTAVAHQACIPCGAALSSPEHPQGLTR